MNDGSQPVIGNIGSLKHFGSLIVPGYKMVYANGPAYKTIKNKTDIKNIKATGSTVFINASTGETIERWNPNTWMIFYVCDNNPMANYTGTQAVNTNTKDPIY